MADSKKEKFGGVVLRCIEGLPSEILFDIFQELPIKSLARAMWTCKRWHTIITDPDFVEKHWKYSIKDYTGYLYRFGADPDIYYIGTNRNVSSNGGDKGELDHCAESIRISHWAIGRTLDEEDHTLRPVSGRWSSGGLFAFIIKKEKCCYVCNPIIGEQIKVPMGPYFGDEDHHKIGIKWWAFGYSPTSKVYKIIVFLQKLKEEVTKGHIYTLGLGSSWRRLPNDFPFLICSFRSAECDGNLFFISSMNALSEFKIVSFDVEFETYRLLKGPNMGSEDRYIPYLLTYGDTVVYVKNYADKRCVSMWVLRDKVNEVWVNELKINTASMRIIPFYSNFRKWINSGTLFGDYGYSSLIIYEEKHKELKPLSLPYSKSSNGYVRKPDCIHHHLASLVSPKRIMGVAVPKVLELGSSFGCP